MAARAWPTCAVNAPKIGAAFVVPRPLRAPASFGQLKSIGGGACTALLTRTAPLRGTSRPSLPPPRSAAQDLEDQDVVDVEGHVIDDRIPVTIITGFLGSGKTTLLNNILTQDHGHRIAVIENEFGEVDIDSDLVPVQENISPDDEQIIMLNNGCICCTVRDDLVQILNKLYERRDKFDRVVIETTGLANPAPVIQTFFLEPSVADRMKLDGVVTLVDAKHVELHLDEEKPKGIVNEAMEQIAYADRILLNKTDLVSSADLDRLESRLRSINSMAVLRRTQQAAVPVDYVLGVGGFDLERVEEDIMGPAKEATSEAHSHEAHSHEDEHEHDHSHEHEHDHKHEHGHECAPGCTHESHAHDHDHHHDHHHHHDDAVGSVSIVMDGDLDLDKVNYWLSGMIEVKSNDLYRMKGVLAIDGFDRRFVFQGVHMLFEGMPDRLWEEGEARCSKMVFIGRDLDEATIKEGFEHCVVRKR